MAQCGKESAHNAWDSGSIPEMGRSPGEGNGNPLLYPYLGNRMDRGASRAVASRLQKSQIWLSNSTTTTNMYMFFLGLFPYRLLKNAESRSLCYAVSPCGLFYTYYCVYVNPNLLTYPHHSFPLWQPEVAFYIRESVSLSQINPFVQFF